MNCTQPSLRFRGISRSFQDIKSLYSMNTERFKACSCKSDIVLFAWRVSWNYVYSPFKLLSLFIFYRKKWSIFSPKKKNISNKILIILEKSLKWIGLKWQFNFRRNDWTDWIHIFYGTGYGPRDCYDRYKIQHFQ